MNVVLHKIYDSMPVLRSAMASGYGYLLRGWRYGPRTEAWVEEALDRETWSSERWESFQDERLAEMLHRAARKVPYYREWWQARRRAGDRSSCEELKNWPVLRKEHLRSNPHAFLAEDRSPGRLFKLDTSGSSGTPVTTWRSRETMQRWYALCEARWRRWYGVDREQRWAMLGGKIVVPFEQARPPFWVWNQGLNQLYMSTFHLKRDNARAYLDAIGSSRIDYMYGYASSMYALARYAIELGLEAPKLKVAISNAEPLLQRQREAITRAFDCRVRDTYGMSEAVTAASECEAGNMHLWPEVGRVEVFADLSNEPVATGEDGRLICTSWLNPDMPLIRYEVGDRGALSTEQGCSCGRSLPRLERIVGRLSDNLLTADGRRVFQMDHVFYQLAVKEAQIIQESVDRIVVKVVPADGYSLRDVQFIEERLNERLGRVRVEVENVDTIARSSNGKFRAVVSNLAA
ncbi:MAG: hypothetical protein WD314_04890 [Trueperaceae bacterium]